MHDAAAARQRILLGGGGHGRVLVDALRACGLTVDGVIDDRPAADLRVKGVPVLGNDDWILSQPAAAIVLINGVGANPSTSSRRTLFDRLRSAGYSFVSVIHPGAVVARDCILGEGVQALARCVIQTGTVIGDNVVLNSGAIVEHDVKVHAHAFIGPGAVVCGDAEIGIGAFIGAGAVVVPGVKIGKRAIVAAGATVIDDVADGAAVLGVPAREHRQVGEKFAARGQSER